MYGTVPNPNLSGPESSSSSSGTISGTTAVNSDDYWRFSVAMTDTVEWMDCIVPYILTIHNSHLTTRLLLDYHTAVITISRMYICMYAW